MAVNGIDLIIPTSIAHSSGSASINAGGSVTFSGVTSLSLNGVFSSTYDNYIIDIRAVSSIDQSFIYRNRLSGTDSTAANYARQSAIANGTTISAIRETSQGFALLGAIGSTQRTGHQIFVYGPNISAPTALRLVSADGISNARIADSAATHSLSTSYDGATFSMGAGTMTGLIKVYGLVK